MTGAAAALAGRPRGVGDPARRSWRRPGAARGGTRCKRFAARADADLAAPGGMSYQRALEALTDVRRRTGPRRHASSTSAPGRGRPPAAGAVGGARSPRSTGPPTCSRRSPSAPARLDADGARRGPSRGRGRRWPTRSARTTSSSATTSCTTSRTSPPFVRALTAAARQPGGARAHAAAPDELARTRCGCSSTGWPGRPGPPAATSSRCCTRPGSARSTVDRWVRDDAGGSDRRRSGWRWSPVGCACRSSASREVAAALAEHPEEPRRPCRHGLVGRLRSRAGRHVRRLTGCRLPAPRAPRRPPAPRCGGRWPGPAPARPWTPPRPPCCCRRAAPTWTGCSSVAVAVRDLGLAAAGRPGVVTYSPKVFVPLTRLCRDRCHYCTFVTVPGRLAAAGQEPFLSPDEVLAIAAAGAAAGCLEALFTLGDRPEDRWPVAARVAGRARATTRRWSTCGRWRSWCWRRPGCCRT